VVVVKEKWCQALAFFDASHRAGPKSWLASARRRESRPSHVTGAQLPETTLVPTYHGEQEQLATTCQPKVRTRKLGFPLSRSKILCGMTPPGISLASWNPSLITTQTKDTLGVLSWVLDQGLVAAVGGSSVPCSDGSAECHRLGGRHYHGCFRGRQDPRAFCHGKPRMHLKSLHRFCPRS